MSLTSQKKSKLQRKYVNAMDQMADVPKSPRKFKYPPTFRNVIGASRETHIGHCKREIGESTVRRGRLRRKTTEKVVCGGRVFLRRGRNGKRRVYCESCKQRKQVRRMVRKLEQRYNRFATPQVQRAEERRMTRALKRFQRKVGR